MTIEYREFVSICIHGFTMEYFMMLSDEEIVYAREVSGETPSVSLPAALIRVKTSQ